MFMRMLINKQNNDKFKLNKLFYFNRELYHFHFCRQADCFVRMLHIYILYIYYRFIVRFLIGLDFLFITFTFLLHLLLSWTSSLSISSSAISASTLSNHVFLGLPTGLLPSTLYSIHFFTQSSSPFLITCPYHLSLPLLMKVVIGSTPTSLLNSSFVLLSFNEIPHIHLIICISALSNFNPTSTSKGLVSLP